ncbi:MAG: hypothetical protein ABFS45_23590 [Pseudomonadota bacterium]
MSEHDRDDREVRACEDLGLTTIQEFLKRDFKDFEVPEDAEFHLSPANSEYESCFARVQLDSYEDLQALGFVPVGLAEDDVRRAIEADDDEIFKLANKMIRQSVQGCSCSTKDAQMPVSQASPVRAVYSRIRKKHNPALAKVLSGHSGARLSWDDPVATITRKWVELLPLHRVIVVAIIGNITIGQNATMIVSGVSRSLLAHSIWIHSTGRLTHTGSYLKIWANSIRRLPEFVTAAELDEARKIAPIWQPK